MCNRERKLYFNISLIGKVLAIYCLQFFCKLLLGVYLALSLCQANKVTFHALLKWITIHCCYSHRAHSYAGLTLADIVVFQHKARCSGATAVLLFCGLHPMGQELVSSVPATADHRPFAGAGNKWQGQHWRSIVADQGRFQARQGWALPGAIRARGRRSQQQ